MEYNNQQLPKKRSRWGIIISIISFLFLCAIILYVVSEKYRKNQIDNLELQEEQNRQSVEALFSVSEYDAIPFAYKKHIHYFLEYNDFLDGTYFLSKISDRASKVFAFGDFTDDDNDEDDMAVVFENYDFKSSKLVIFNHKGELLFVKDFDGELITINYFKVGSKIYMDGTKLEPSPVGGLIIKAPNSKYALVYDKDKKMFHQYYQYTEYEIKEMEYDREELLDTIENSEFTVEDGYEDM